MTRLRLVKGGIALLALVLAIWGCRTPVETEGDLSVDAFESRLSSLTKDPAGQWFVVATVGQRPGPYLTVEHDGQTHLFATRVQGKRSAELFALSRPDPDWLQQAYEESATLEFHDNLRHRRVDSTLGLWRGGTTDDIRWLGPAPESPTRAVAIPAEVADGPRSLPEWIRGTVDVDADGVTARHDAIAADDGPYLVIPDGELSENAPRALWFGQQPPVDADFGSWRWETLSEAQVEGSAELAQLAGLHSVEVAVARQGPDLRIGFASDSGMPGRGAWEQPVALAESGFLIDGRADEQVVRTALKAVDDLYSDHPLSAAYRLREIDGQWSVDSNPEATRLRHQDLVAAGGYLCWMRAAVLEDRGGIGPEASLYLARAHAYSGHQKAVYHYADRALRFFSERPPTHGAVPMGRARVLMADAHRSRNDGDAEAEALKRARDDFLRAQDPYRAAVVRRRLLLSGHLDDVDVTVADLVRAGADYEASRTLLLVAAANIEEGALDEGRANLSDWTERFGDAPPSRLKWLSWALSTRIDWLEGHGVDGTQIDGWQQQAESARAWEAMLVFALTQYEWRAMHEVTDLQRLGELLVESRKRSRSELLGGDVDATMAVICTELTFGTTTRGNGAMARYCDDHVDESTQTVEGLVSLLEGGYRFIQRGELSAAGQLERFVFDALPDDADWPAARAKIHLFEAALAEEFRVGAGPATDDDDEVVDAIQQTFDIIHERLPAKTAPELLSGLGELFELRGMDRVAMSLYEASVQAARQTGRDSNVFERSLELARVAHRAEAWELLAQMDNVDSPLHAVRIDLYRGHARIVDGDAERGQKLIDEALDQVDEFGALQQLAVRTLAAYLAVERDDLEEARRHIEWSTAAMDDFPEGLAERDETRTLKAGLEVIDARLFIADGDVDKAREAIDEGLRIARDVDTEAKHRLRLEAYQVAIDVAADADQRDRLVGELRDESRQWADDITPLSRRDASRHLVEIHLEDAEGDRAMRRVRSVLGDGRGLATRRVVHHCLVAKTELIATAEATKFHLDRCRAHSDTKPAARAQLLAAMADAELQAAPYRVELVHYLRQMIPEASPGEVARLTWMVEYAEPEREAQPEVQEQLADHFTFSRANVDPDKPDEDYDWSIDERLDAAVELAHYLMDAGRFEVAQKKLAQAEMLGRRYFRDELEAEELWLVLRARLAAKTLQPFAAMDYVDEAFEHTRFDDDERRARLYYYRAVAHLQLGQPFPALEAIDEGRTLAEDDSETAEMIDELESTIDAIRFGR